MSENNDRGYWYDLMRPDHLYIQVPIVTPADLLGTYLSDIMADLELPQAEQIKRITIERV